MRRESDSNRCPCGGIYTFSPTWHGVNPPKSRCNHCGNLEIEINSLPDVSPQPYYPPSQEPPSSIRGVYTTDERKILEKVVRKIDILKKHILEKEQDKIYSDRVITEIALLEKIKYLIENLD